VNEVGRAVVDIIVVTLMTQALPIVYIVAQVWIILHRLNVVRLKPFVTAAHLASIRVTFKNSLTPSQIVRAAPTLRVPRVATLGYALAFYAAIGVPVGLFQAMINHIRVGAPELFTANLARAKRRIGKRAAAPRAINMSPYMRRRPLKLLATVLTNGSYLLGLRLRGARTRAVPLLGILGPTAVGLLADDCPAGLAGL